MVLKGGKGRGAFHSNRKTQGGSTATNTVAPVLTDSILVGETLSTTDGTWTGGGAFTYQWQREMAAGWTNISGATSNSYVRQGVDAGARLRCAVSTNGATANSNASAYGAILASSRLGIGTLLSNGTDTSSNSDLLVYNDTGTGVTKCRLVIPNWRLNLSGNGVDTTGMGTVNIRAAVWDSTATTLIGVFLFTGSATGTVAAGANLVSDELTLGSTWASGATLLVRTYATMSAGTKWCQIQINTTTTQERCNFNTGVDLTQTSGTYTNQQAAGKQPIAVGGIVATAFSAAPSRMAVMGVGDSKTAVSALSSPDSHNNSSYPGIAMTLVGAPYAICGLSSSSASAFDDATGFAQITNFAKAICVTNIHGNWAVNDLTAGRTSAQILANITSLKSRIETAGFTATWSTTEPRTSINTALSPNDPNSWLSVNNQEPSTAAFTGGAASTWAVVNAGIRSLFGAGRYAEVADAVTTAPDVACWRTSDSNPSDTSYAPKVTGLLTGTPTTTNLPTNINLTGYVANRFGGGRVHFPTGVLAGSYTQFVASSQTIPNSTITTSALTSAPAAGDQIEVYPVGAAGTTDGTHPYFDFKAGSGTLYSGQKAAAVAVKTVYDALKSAA